MITDESASAMNFGNAIRYCHDLSSGGFTDWRMPSHDELMSTLSNGAISVPNPSSANPVFFRDLVFSGSTASLIVKQFRLSDGTYPTIDYYYNSQSARVRCVR
jgi:hypothetical protein